MLSRFALLKSTGATQLDKSFPIEVQLISNAVGFCGIYGIIAHCPFQVVPAVDPVFSVKLVYKKPGLGNVLVPDELVQIFSRVGFLKDHPLSIPTAFINFICKFVDEQANVSKLVFGIQIYTYIQQTGGVVGSAEFLSIGEIIVKVIGAIFPEQALIIFIGGRPGSCE